MFTNIKDSPNPAHYHCEFCSEFSGETDNTFHALYRGTMPHRHLLVTDNFRIFPSIGQIVEGYLLIAPVHHYCTLDELPTELVGELAAICERARSIVSQNYGPCISFEHGARGPVNGGCGIYHAHLHIVPLCGTPDPVAALKEHFPYKKLDALRDIAEVPSRNLPYLFFEDLDSNRYLFSVGNLESQYMRRVLAQAMGTSDWNWRNAGIEERLLTTIHRLSGQFDNTQKFSYARNL